MDIKDWIFAQNWVEQWKANNPISLDLCCAFTWATTHQGVRVWQKRNHRQFLETEI